MTQPKVNQRQVAGTHYKSEFQHWDLVIETNMPYTLGCATKYLTRWKKKNGLQDLEKAIHYLEKTHEAGILMERTPANLRLFQYFIAQTIEGGEQSREATILYNILAGLYNYAIDDIRGLMSQHSAQAVS